jgi:Beta-propeller repeat
MSVSGFAVPWRRVPFYFGLPVVVATAIAILAGANHSWNARSGVSLPVGRRTAPVLFYADPAGKDTGAMLGRSPRMTARFTPGVISYSTANTTVRMRFLNANDAVPEGAAQSGRLTVAGGAELEKWLQGAVLYQKVKYPSVYKGIDLVYGGSSGAVKSEYLVAPGAAPSQIRFQFDGADRISVSGGELVVHLHGMEFRESAPEAYQNGRRGRESVRAYYHLFDDGSVGFSLEAYDHTRPLVIDPEVSFSTFWGGSQFDALTGVVTGPDGSIYVCGWTESADVPTVGAYQPAERGSTDAFVMKLTASNTIAYATYLGGSGQDRANAIAVDASGSVYITGWTASANFPLMSAIQRQLLGSRNAFVTKLSPSGVPVFSTYFGGHGADSANSIQVDPSGAIYIAGQTTSTDFPTLNAKQPRLGGIEDAFVAKLGPSGTVLVYSTYLGGSGSDQAFALATLNGEVYITGATDSPNFPTANAFRSSNQGGQDAFVAKLNSAGSVLVYSTYLGGSSGSAGLPEVGFGLAVTTAGEAVVAGTTASNDFPLVTPVRPGLIGSNNDAFVAKLNAAGSQLLFSTYLGGSGFDSAKAVAVDSSGMIYVAGETTSRDMAVVSPVQTSNAGLYNAFVASLTADGASLRFSSYWGGSASDSAAAIALGGSANLVIVGSTTSWNLPLKSSLQTFNGSNYGGFVAAFSGVVPALRLAIYNAGHWVLNFNSGQNFWFGIPGDVPVVGDWDGSGRPKIGVYRNGEWFLDYNGSNGWDGLGVDRSVGFGVSGDVPVVGDWNGTGRLRIGVYRNGQWFLDMNGNLQWDGFGIDRDAWFGVAGDIPVVGDWDGTGRLRIGVYRNGEWLLDVNGNLQWDGLGIDRDAGFGVAGDIPVVGDWDGTGRLRIGVYRNGQWFLDMNGNLQWDGNGIDRIYSFGSPGDKPVGAKW